VSDLEEIRKNLWSTNVAKESYPDTAFQRDLLEQYKLCLEMADRISARRGAANTFFLTFNTSVVGALGVLFDRIPQPAAIAIYVATVGFSIAWLLLLRSYRSLNTAKFKVIGLIEEGLPASPFYAAEWKALGEGKDWRKHIPLSPIETIVPVLFAACYVYLAILTIGRG
jgi:hypothetical protein